MPGLTQRLFGGRRITGKVIVAGLVVASLGSGLIRTIFASEQPLIPGYAKAAPAGQFAEVKWDDLRKGDWPRKGKPVVRDAVATAAGQSVKLRGFILPLHNAGEASEFFLAASPGGCYFCNPPGVAEVVMVKIAGGQKLEPTTRAVEAYGTFKVATGAPDDQSLYTLDESTLVIAG